MSGNLIYCTLHCGSDRFHSYLKFLHCSLYPRPAAIYDWVYWGNTCIGKINDHSILLTVRYWQCGIIILLNVVRCTVDVVLLLFHLVAYIIQLPLSNNSKAFYSSTMYKYHNIPLPFYPLFPIALFTPLTLPFCSLSSCHYNIVHLPISIANHTPALYTSINIFTLMAIPNYICC